MLGTRHVRTRHVQARGRHVAAWWAALALFAVLGALLWVLHPTTDARLELRSAIPAPSDHLEQSPDRIALELGRPWTPGAPTTIEVIGPDDQNLARGRATVTSGGLSQRLAPTSEEGAYQVAYRTLLPDGRTVAGNYWFIYEPGPLATGRRATALASLAVLVALTGVMLLRRRWTPIVVRPAPAFVPVGPEPLSSPVPRQRDPHDADSLSRPQQGSTREDSEARVGRPD